MNEDSSRIAFGVPLYPLLHLLFLLYTSHCPLYLIYKLGKQARLNFRLACLSPIRIDGSKVR